MTTWVEDIVDAIMAVGGVAHLSEIYDYIKRNTSRTSKVAWQQNTRQRIYDNTTDASQFKGPEDIFYAAGESGDGIWGVRPEWLKAKGRIAQVPRKIRKAPAKSAPTREPMVAEENDSFERIGRTTYQLPRNAARARRLKELYKYSCQVCGTTIRLEGGLYAETHHIRPRNAHNGQDFWNNMIVLCPNHHVEFDDGVLCIDPDSMCFLHKYDTAVHGSKVSLLGEHQLKKENLEYAKKTFFHQELQSEL